MATVSIGLVGCSGPKLSGPAPASRLYASQMFRSAVTLAKQLHEFVYVISAKYELVALDQMIERYDLTMADVAKEWRVVWGARVWGAIQNRHPGVDRQIYIYAGKDYAQPIRHAGSSRASFYEPLAKMQIGQRNQWLRAQLTDLTTTPKDQVAAPQGSPASPAVTTLETRARSAQRMSKILRIPAIEVRQGKRIIYTLAIDGKCLPQVATVSRIKRDDDGMLAGYQRPEVLSHIEQIKNYIEGESPMLPNAIVIAFDSRVSFTAGAGPRSDFSRVGELAIPVDPAWEPQDRPGFVVDGQQRLAAIRDARVDSFPICVSAFIVDDVSEQTEQFILVNSTKPLPKGLIYELLPGTEAALPRALARRRLPAAILTRLNRDASSPLRSMIQTATNPNGIVKDNSILKMLENSLSDGALYRIHQGNGDAAPQEPLLSLLSAFWGAVSDVFPAEWRLPPKKCRLLHGAGIMCLGFMMDAIAERYRDKGPPTREQFAHDLAALVPVCRWSEGHWNFGPGQQRKWNEIQNTSKDIQLLSNYLLLQYKNVVWGRRPPRAKATAAREDKHPSSRKKARSRTSPEAVS